MKNKVRLRHNDGEWGASVHRECYYQHVKNVAVRKYNQGGRA